MPRTNQGDHLDLVPVGEPDHFAKELRIGCPAFGVEIGTDLETIRMHNRVMRGLDRVDRDLECRTTVHRSPSISLKFDHCDPHALAGTQVALCIPEPVVPVPLVRGVLRLAQEGTRRNVP